MTTLHKRVESFRIPRLKPSLKKKFALIEDIVNQSNYQNHFDCEFRPRYSNILKCKVPQLLLKDRNSLKVIEIQLHPKTYDVWVYSFSTNENGFEDKIIKDIIVEYDGFDLSFFNEIMKDIINK